MDRRISEAQRRTKTSGRLERASMTNRQLDAYLQSRDAVRRIQRISGLLSDVPRRLPPSAPPQRSLNAA